MPLYVGIAAACAACQPDSVKRRVIYFEPDESREWTVVGVSYSHAVQSRARAEAALLPEVPRARFHTLIDPRQVFQVAPVVPRAESCNRGDADEPAARAADAPFEAAAHGGGVGESLVLRHSQIAGVAILAVSTVIGDHSVKAVPRQTGLQPPPSTGHSNCCPLWQGSVASVEADGAFARMVLTVWWACRAIFKAVLPEPSHYVFTPLLVFVQRLARLPWRRSGPCGATNLKLQRLHTLQLFLSCANAAVTVNRAWK